MRPVIAAVLLAIGAGTAGAQGLPWLSANVGGGGTFSLGGAREAVGDGWNIDAGATVRVTDRVGVRLDYQYSRFAPQALVAQTFDPSSLATVTTSTPVSGRLQMHVGSFDAVYAWPIRNGRGTAYVLGGPSVAKRRATVTGLATGVVLDFCEPQWFRCSAGLEPFDQATGVRETVDLGVNVGGGLTFDVGLRARVFVEARYLWIHGPTYTGTSGTAQANAAFLPVVAGLRF